MTEVVSVRFKDRGKVYFFDPGGNTVETGDDVIVETSKGNEFGICAQGNHEVSDDRVIPPLRPIVRVATDKDREQAENNRTKEKEAMAICQQKIEKHGLEMKLVDAEYNFDGDKVIFFFTSDGRVDFRELVKDLASVLKTRIELRQIGVRDEAKMLGGFGICGRPFCCSEYLDDFQPVSIKMAKTQGLSLNPTKISGTCGRLMCCLKYEQEAYEDLIKQAPKSDAFVDTPDGKGSVTDVNLLRGTARVRLEGQLENPVKTYRISELEVLGGKAKRAEYLAELEAEREQKAQQQAERRLNRTAPKKEDAQRPQEQPRKNEQPRHQRRQGQEQAGENQERRQVQSRPGQPKAQPQPQQSRNGEIHTQPQGGQQQSGGGNRRRRYNSRGRRPQNGPGGQSSQQKPEQ